VWNSLLLGKSTERRLFGELLDILEATGNAAASRDSAVMSGMIMILLHEVVWRQFKLLWRWPSCADQFVYLR
jgi:hypothetical protein